MEGPGSIRELLLVDWFRHIREAKSREDRKRINRIFRDMAKAIKHGYNELNGTGSKKTGWAAVLPKPADPLGVLIYSALTRGSGSEEDCPICRVTAVGDMIERGVAGCPDESGAVAEILRLYYRIEMGLDKPEDLIEKLKPIFEKYHLDPDKFSIG